MNDDKQERERAKLAQGLADIMELFPLRCDLERFNAKVTRVKYLSLVAEGFTQEQALELCKKL